MKKGFNAPNYSTNNDQKFQKIFRWGEQNMHLCLVIFQRFLIVFHNLSWLYYMPMVFRELKFIHSYLKSKNKYLKGRNFCRRHFYDLRSVFAKTNINAPSYVKPYDFQRKTYKKWIRFSKIYSAKISSVNKFFYLGNSYSDWRLIKYGVAQGSISGVNSL